MSEQQNTIPNLSDEEITRLESCSSADEWNQTCSAIKKVRGGKYPPDWWPKMKLTGRMDRILASFGETTKLTLTTIDAEGKRHTVLSKD